MSRPTVTTYFAILLASATAATVAACGNSTGPLDRENASMIAAQAVTDTTSASDITMSGTFPVQGTSLRLTLTRKAGDGCSVAITESTGGTINIIGIGTKIWMRPDSGWWAVEKRKAASAGNAAEANAMIGKLEGKYLEGSTADTGMSSATSLCDVGKLLSEIKPSRTTRKGAPMIVDGQRALPLTGLAGTTGTVYVTDTYSPRILSIVSSNGKQSVNVSYVSPTVTAPPANETVNASRFGM